MRILVLSSIAAVLALATSCSNAPQQQANAPVVTAHQPPKDLAQKFVREGQLRMQLIPDHLLGKDFMPGGNLAEYKTESGQFQMFLLEASDAQRAAFMLLDWKAVMPTAEYLAHMGGYFGKDEGTPLYIFSKGPYLAGIIGLSEEKADVEARRFAARL